MRKILILCFFFLSSFANAQKMSNQDYVEQFKDIAMQEMRDHKIPASITLAQGILESGSGNSRLANEGNNHFGIKCKKNWTGRTIIEDDDEKNECFRAYDNAFESYKDHSLFLKQNQRYAFLFELSILDYQGWAEGLRKAGYATNQRYPQLLIGIIERLNLAHFDTLVFYGEDQVYFVDNSIKPHVQIVDNGIPLTIARPGQNARKIADEHNMREWQIFKYNDLPKGSRIEPGMVVYLKPKRNKAAVPQHQVDAGESMWEISQKYGIKLKKLYRKNRMEPGTEVKPGETLNMRRRTKVMPDTGRVEVREIQLEPPTTVKPSTNTHSVTVIDEVPNHYPEEPIDNAPQTGKLFHIIQQGETLYGISRTLGVSVDELKQWNKLNDNNLKVGETLVYYKSNPIKLTNNPEFHIVKHGETLFGISKLYGISVDDIKAFNNLSNNDIRIGQQLKLKK